MKLFYRIVKSLFKTVFVVFYRHKTYGLEHIPKGSGIIAPNHISFFDPPLVGISCPEEVSFLAKESLLTNPVLGPVLRNLNTYPVSGAEANLSSIKTVCQLLEQDKKVVIFPEGERALDGKLTDVKPGIAILSLRTNAPIIPTFIHGTYEIWPRGQFFPKPWGKTVCAFGSPIYPKNFQNLEKREARTAIADAIRESIHNLREWYHAGAKGNPP